MAARREPEGYSPSVYSQPSMNYSRASTMRTTSSNSDNTISTVSSISARSEGTIVPTHTNLSQNSVEDFSDEKGAGGRQNPDPSPNSALLNFSRIARVGTSYTPLLEEQPMPPPPHLQSSSTTFHSPIYKNSEASVSRRKTANVPDFGFPLPRFIIRGIISIVIPVALVVYYFLTWWRWLRFPEGSSEVWQRTGILDNVNIVNYSWFVIATFALNLGTYAVAGSVAGMVMRKRWAPKNFRRLLILSGNTFQDPAGWFNALIKLVQKRRLYKRNGTLWDILAFFSIIGFAAWPLTGLTMQTQDGFTISRRYKGDEVFVVGRNHSSINGRDGALTTSRVTTFWSSGFSPQLPLRKQFYITPGSSIQLNVSSPDNTLPDDASESIFLGPQSMGPLVGSVFGLAIRYNCSIVNQTSQFTVLSRRNDTFDLDRSGSRFGYVLPDQSVIIVRNQSRSINLISNVNGSLELGTSMTISELADPTDSESIGYASIFESYPGLNSTVVLEAALWQSISPIESYGRISVNPENFNFRDAENDIPEFRNTLRYPGQKAVGVRCEASSAIGTALINGVDGTYTNFTQLDAEIRNGGGIKRFETGIPHMIVQTPYIPSNFQLSDNVDWFSALYASIEMSSLTTNAFGDFLGAAPSVLQAEDLKRAILRAYKTHAVHIMYDGLADPTFAWKLENVTMGTPTMILTRGVVPPEIILGMLMAWAMAIVILSVTYQFRRRWTETLDGYTIFRFGVDRPDDVLPEMLAGEFDNAAVLEKLPGMVGDLEPDNEVGYIGLVRGGQEADWGKRYG
ncbi:hypothetical protein TWF106_010595 [Orbilia oligospora]|uniref:Uncharacterized protein n=1 Tax=Orbilia oligospora TaxID=2813651 RepID=A0A7C8V1W3_ORBOL|nr:hypothetical protein TWF679_004971 [Orbilia oligospora]KAF3227107.1 hypothetical protein TWF106_010595 [Orbilia oligospora]